MEPVEDVRDRTHRVLIQLGRLIWGQAVDLYGVENPRIEYFRAGQLRFLVDLPAVVSENGIAGGVAHWLPLGPFPVFDGRAALALARKRVVQGKRVSVRVDVVGCGNIKTKKK